ncbi:B12-binding domain-containing radical SAM protein [Geomesophilobacter sediminis]|uniref:Radical SAM protein n=1 Tax=Geomesophilobacter sediminis TaxID=2798584 RepID=A0A8J7M2R2_9BACT|nr:radical SAM protein [Geomesophilobacter sediminis]MBJ6727557.1 radical SAM protein [Geomesophilobacter sediminis]
MKIVIVENPRPLTIEHYNDVANAPLSASLNSGYALAVAREAGWETCHLDFTRSAEGDASLAAAILATGADLVLFHWVYSWGNDGRVAGIIDLLQRERHVIVGAFGLFPTLAGAALFGFAGGLDCLLIGEFEASLKELLLSMECKGRPTGIAGVALPGEPFRRREVHRDLSWLPIPDDVGINAGLSSINVAASRGCFGNCGFCFIPTYYGAPGRRVRAVESLEAELDARLARRKADHAYFIDPTFFGIGAAEKERVRRIGKLLAQRRVGFGFECRVDTVDRDLLEDLGSDGATDIFLGVESGCDAALRRMNKRVTKEDIVRAVKSVQQVGINLHVGFIMFEPDTTLDEVGENFRFLEELGLLSDPDRTVNLLYHSQIVLYGSRSWERFEREGRLLKDERLPFEASFTFRDPKVAKVCAGMKEIATEYFLKGEGKVAAEHIGTCGRDGSEAVNAQMKESFLRLLREA